MIGSFICAVCTLALVVVAILVTIRAVSLEEAAKAIGRIVLVFVLVLIAVCLLREAVITGVPALMVLLKTFVRWLIVTVFVIAMLILLLWMLSRKSVTRRSAKSNHDGDEW